MGKEREKAVRGGAAASGSLRLLVSRRSRTVVGNGGKEEEEAISGTSTEAHAQKNNAVLAFESDDIDVDVRTARACRNAKRATKELQFFRMERTTIFLTILDLVPSSPLWYSELNTKPHTNAAEAECNIRG